jgi:hypothetical protein
MDALDLQLTLDSLAHDLDMMVFRLETTKATNVKELVEERNKLLVELEAVRDQIIEVSRQGGRL